MAWTIEYSGTSQRRLRKLDEPAAQRIVNNMGRRLKSDNPPRDCIPLTTPPREKLCRYRIGGYRVICEIRYKTEIILVTEIKKRGDNPYRNL